MPVQISEKPDPRNGRHAIFSAVSYPLHTRYLCYIYSQPNHKTMTQKLLRNTALATFTALTLLSCSQGAKPTASFDAAGTKTAIEARNQAFAAALKKGDSVAVANFYTDDAALLGGGPAVTGHDKLVGEFGGLIRAGLTEAKFTTEGVWGTDSLVTEQGRAVFSNKNMQPMSQGAYMVIWKKAGDEWKLFRDMYSADAPPKSK
jgi:ketosteroid isomerase-like protein